jgi:hypothetical protein
MADVLASLSWNSVEGATAGPLWYGIVLVAIALLSGREMWMTYRGTRPVALSLVTMVLTAAAFAIVVVRALALAR